MKIQTTAVRSKPAKRPRSASPCDQGPQPAPLTIHLPATRLPAQGAKKPLGKSDALALVGNPFAVDLAHPGARAPRPAVSLRVSQALSTRQEGYAFEFSRGLMQQALDLSGVDVAALATIDENVEMAQFWTDVNRLDRAIAILRDAQGAAPNDIRIAFRLAEVAYASGDARLAVQTARACSLIAPGDAGAKIMYARALSFAGDTRTAFDTLAAMDPANRDAEFWTVCASVLSNGELGGDAEAGIGLAEAAALALAPWSCAHFVATADTLTRRQARNVLLLGVQDRIEPLCDALIRNRDGMGHFYLACVHATLGEDAQALHSMSRALGSALPSRVLTLLSPDLWPLHQHHAAWQELLARAEAAPHQLAIPSRQVAAWSGEQSGG